MLHLHKGPGSRVDFTISVDGSIVLDGMVLKDTIRMNAVGIGEILKARGWEETNRDFFVKKFPKSAGDLRSSNILEQYDAFVVKHLPKAKSSEKKSIVNSDTRPVFKLVICGSRDIKEDVTPYISVIDSLLKDKVETHRIVIISGCAKGGDLIGEKYAELKGYEIHRYPADWNRYGKSAGYKRNEKMVAVGTAILAIWDGKSKGTKHTIDIARKAMYNKPVRVISPKEV